MDFFTTAVSPRAIAAVTEVLESGWLSEGSRVRQFEEALEERLGLRHPVATNSGTSALHLALAVAGVGAGDEVVLPAQTFVATGLVILMQGAVPVFADVDPDTGNLDPASFADKITPRTKAVIPVHWAGDPCDLEAIGRVAGEHDVAVIEDAAHALGATYRGRPIGAVSRMTCFSFQAIKHLTTGDGGALCCLEEAEHQAARRRRWFGIDRARSEPSILGERRFDIVELGYKYHMNDLAAAVGLANLEDFPAQLERRREICCRYTASLGDVAGVRLLRRDDDASACWIYPLRVERREDMIRALSDRGVPASVVHQRIDRYSVFGGVRDDLPGQALFDATQVCLPAHAGLSEADVEQVVAAVRAGW